MKMYNLREDNFNNHILQVFTKSMNGLKGILNSGSIGGPSCFRQSIFSIKPILEMLKPLLGYKSFKLTIY